MVNVQERLRSGKREEPSSGCGLVAGALLCSCGATCAHRTPSPSSSDQTLGACVLVTVNFVLAFQLLAG